MRSNSVLSLSAWLSLLLMIVVACAPTSPPSAANPPAAPKAPATTQPPAAAKAPAATQASAPAPTQPAQASGPAQAAGSKTLTVGLGAFPATLSPGESGNPSLMLLLQFNDSLTKLSPDLKVEPNLAESWKLIDNTTWEFKLRPNVKFHNGEPFNAQAVKFTYERTLDTSRPYSRRSRIGLVKEIEVVDDLTLRLKTSSPYPLLAFGVYAIPIQPPSYIGQVGEEAYLQKPVGTGPFKVSEWVPNQQLVVEANQEYWGGRPKVDRVVFKQIPDSSARLAALQAGEIDIMDQVPIDMLPRLETGTTTVASANVAAGLGITFNLLEEGPLRDLRVRQAVDMAIDREAIFKSLYKGYGAVLDGQITTKGAFGYNPNLKPTAYNPDKAKQLLAEAGYPNGVTLDLTSPVNKYVGDREIILAVAAQLKKVGIETNVNFMEYAAFSAAQNNKKLKDMHMIGWYNLGDAESALIWYSNLSDKALFTFPEFDETLQKARTEMNPAEREKLLQKSAEIMAQDLPATMLLQFPALYGVNKRVNGFAPRQDELIGELYKVELK